MFSFIGSPTSVTPRGFGALLLLAAGWLLASSCAPSLAGRTARLPAGGLSSPEVVVSAEGLPVHAAPAETVEVALEQPVAAAEPAEEAAPAPEPVLPIGLPYVEEVERWRGPVRAMIHEVRAEGRLHGPASVLDEDLVLAMIEQESGGDPNAESWAGARGLLQLMPESFAWIMGIHDWGEDVNDVDVNFLFDPQTNLRAGVRFLAAVLEEQGGSPYWALASYNAGGGMVNGWRAAGFSGIPAWYGGGETANYAPAILGNYAAHRPDAAVHIPAPVVEAPAPRPAPPPVRQVPVQRSAPAPVAKAPVAKAPAPKPSVRR